MAGLEQIRNELERAELEWERMHDASDPETIRLFLLRRACELTIEIHRATERRAETLAELHRTGTPNRELARVTGASEAAIEVALMLETRKTTRTGDGDVQESER